LVVDIAGGGGGRKLRVFENMVFRRILGLGGEVGGKETTGET